MKLLEQLEVIIDEYGNVGLSFGDLKDGEIEEIKQQILLGQKALEELPKLREQAYNLLAEKEQTRTDFISYKKLAEITVKQKEEENQKLKAENEELKKPCWKCGSNQGYMTNK